MPAFLKAILAYILPSKSVSTIVASMEKTVTDLESHAASMAEAAMAHAAAAAKAEEAKLAATAEFQAAKTVAGKIAALLSPETEKAAA